MQLLQFIATLCSQWYFEMNAFFYLEHLQIKACSEISPYLPFPSALPQDLTELTKKISCRLQSRKRKFLLLWGRGRVGGHTQLCSELTLTLSSGFIPRGAQETNQGWMHENKLLTCSITCPAPGIAYFITSPRIWQSVFYVEYTQGILCAWDSMLNSKVRFSHSEIMLPSFLPVREQ